MEGSWVRFSPPGFVPSSSTGCVWPASCCRRRSLSAVWRSIERAAGNQRSGCNMLLIVLSICAGGLAAAVLAATMVGKGTSKPGALRLAALDHEFAPTEDEEKVTDIRKQQRHLSAIPWLNHWLTELNLAPVSTLYLYQAGVTLTLGILVL